MTFRAPMHYHMACDLPGRLRVRFGRNAFSSEEGYGIADKVLSIPGVIEVKTSVPNGGVLVAYDSSCTGVRESVLDVLGSFYRRDLPQA